MDGEADDRDADPEGGRDGAHERPADRRAGYLGVARELAKLLGGLLLIALGLYVSIGIVTAVIGVPMMIAGYAVYRSSALSGRRERSVRMDYRDE